MPLSSCTEDLIWLCLDENGEIVRDSLAPVLVKPLAAEVFTAPPGTQIGWTRMDDFGFEVAQEGSLVFGCANCVKETEKLSFASPYAAIRNDTQSHSAKLRQTRSEQMR